MSKAYIKGPEITVLTTAAVAQWARVKLAISSSGQITAATADGSNKGEAVAMEAIASGYVGRVLMMSSGCVVPMIASAGIVAGAKCYATASGKIDDTGSVLCCRAIEAATNDGDVIYTVPLDA